MQAERDVGISQIIYFCIIEPFQTLKKPARTKQKELILQCISMYNRLAGSFEKEDHTHILFVTVGDGSINHRKKCSIFSICMSPKENGVFGLSAYRAHCPALKYNLIH